MQIVLGLKLDCITNLINEIGRKKLECEMSKFDATLYEITGRPYGAIVMLHLFIENINQVWR